MNGITHNVHTSLCSIFVIPYTTMALDDSIVCINLWISLTLVSILIWASVPVLSGSLPIQQLDLMLSTRVFADGPVYDAAS